MKTSMNCKIGRANNNAQKTMIILSCEFPYILKNKIIV